MFRQIKISYLIFFLLFFACAYHSKKIFRTSGDAVVGNHINTSRWHGYVVRGHTKNGLILNKGHDWQHVEFPVEFLKNFKTGDTLH